MQDQYLSRYLYCSVNIITKSVTRYDLKTGQWSPVAPATINCSRFVFLNSKPYALGETHYRNSRLANLARFDYMSNTWIPILAPMQTERSYFMLEVFQDRLYAVGGYALDATTMYHTVVGTVEYYDDVSNMWTVAASMRVPRHNVKLHAFKGKLYAIGGDGYECCKRVVECYNPLLNEWTVMASLSIGRVDFDVGVLNGKLYVVGGSDKCRALSSVECYDKVKNQWTTVAPMNMARSSHCITELNGKLYAIGGITDTGVTQSVECYDDVSNQWTLVASMNTRRAVPVCHIRQGKLFVFHRQPSNDHGEWYDDLKDEWHVI